MLKLLRARAGRMGIFTILFTLLFAVTPSLQAMACAAEGCNPACSERSFDETTVDADDPSSDNCVDSHCVCAAGHCSHSAITVPAVDAAFTPVSRATNVRIEPSHLVSVTLQTPERPPRG